MIIYTSDHGEMLGDCGTYQKFQPYEASAHVPMIIKFPRGMKPAVAGDALMTLNDLCPTMLDAASIPFPTEARLDGHSLFDSEAPRDSVFIEYGNGSRRWISIRTREYKYNYYYALGHEELFDLRQDPQELRNLLENPSEQSRRIADHLKAELARKEDAYGYGDYLENGQMKVLPDYEPFLYHELNFPFFIEHLTEDEKKGMLSNLDEIKLSIADEATESLDNLDLSLLPENRQGGRNGTDGDA